MKQRILSWVILIMGVFLPHLKCFAETKQMNTNDTTIVSHIQKFEAENRIDEAMLAIKNLDELLISPDSGAKAVTGEEAVECFGLAVRLLAAVEKKIVADVPQPSRNVAIEGYRSGVAPETIKDPDDRKKYLQAIEDNERKIEILKVQTNLRHHRDALVKIITGSASKVYTDPAGRSKETRRLLSAHQISDGIQKMILESIEAGRR